MVNVCYSCLVTNLYPCHQNHFISLYIFPVNPAVVVGQGGAL